MASGHVTGFQHQLIDEPELTKEKFAALCDNWFYHLERYGVQSHEELEDTRMKEIERYTQEINTQYEELSAISNASQDDLHKEYESYARDTLESNEKYREVFHRESERMKQIREYASHFSPHLEYIWSDLKDPELFELPLLSYDEWIKERIHNAKNSIKFYTDLKEKASLRDDITNEHGQRVQDYESRKRAFLSSE